MRWILDSNSFIYLIKANLGDLFQKLAESDIVIDTSVYREVVEVGIEKGYSDAQKAKKFLEKYSISIISIDVSPELSKFRDPGETSCYLLARQEGICLSSDLRATKKFSHYMVAWMQLDTFFYQKFLNKKLPKEDLIEILQKLEKVHATTPERRLTILKKI